MTQYLVLMFLAARVLVLEFSLSMKYDTIPCFNVPSSVRVLVHLNVFSISMKYDTIPCFNVPSC